MADEQLSKDLLMEVLIRLPVKSIIKFKCVSKTWCDLIRDPVFIQGHQKRNGKERVLLVKQYSSPQNGDGEEFSFSDLSIPISDDFYGHLHMMIQNLPPQSGGGETFSSHDQEFPEPEDLVSPNLSISILNSLNIPWHRHSNIPIHGPCNGIVCITFEKTVFLCNPALREFKLLPPPGFPEGYIPFPFQYGFGFDPITGAYKVIQISDMRHEVPKQAEFWHRPKMNSLRIDLYNSASDSWKQIHGVKLPNLSYLPGHELLYNGTIHWAIIAADSFPCILCFDVSTETFRQLEFHDNFGPSERDLRLMEFNERLAVVRYSPDQWIEPRKIEIWVMTEYGEKGSWTKQFVIPPYCDICPFTFLKNELVLVESGNGRSASCELHGNQFKGFQFYGAHRSMTAVFYNESLISLNEITGSDRRDE
ncbi:F-box/kelch-repeat protein At3g06240-like [Primulina eburnea]|uniref:F-box/kelch-repeat protein At3g06240-like n=1 Tax=Primulina eburnea TaxID=1245227 RepID=UPI003C6C2951